MQKLSVAELSRTDPQGYRLIKKLPLVVVLDDVRSGLNVGSVFRSADAFLIEEIVLCGISPCPPHREVLKTALGATESVQWRHAEKIENVLVELKEKNYRIAAVEQVKGSRNLAEISSDVLPLALVFGNEMSGLSEKALRLCDMAIEIPQSGIKHSLNISVCAGILFWEFYRQHNYGQG